VLGYARKFFCGVWSVTCGECRSMVIVEGSVELKKMDKYLGFGLRKLRG